VVDVDEGTTWEEDEAHSDEEVAEEQVTKEDDDGCGLEAVKSQLSEKYLYLII
jgi:hypothetical protein